jgi:hypothetical protein
MKIGAMGGVLPQLIAGGGKNAGFGLGIVPGLLYKDYYKNKEEEEEAEKAAGMKRGGKVKAKGSSASKRADGCAVKGKTKGRMV